MGEEQVKVVIIRDGRWKLDRDTLYGERVVVQLNNMVIILALLVWGGKREKGRGGRDVRKWTEVS